jgi:hypothetical protein
MAMWPSTAAIMTEKAPDRPCGMRCHLSAGGRRLIGRSQLMHFVVHQRAYGSDCRPIWKYSPQRGHRLNATSTIEPPQATIQTYPATSNVRVPELAGTNAVSKRSKRYTSGIPPMKRPHISLRRKRIRASPGSSSGIASGTSFGPQGHPIALSPRVRSSEDRAAQMRRIQLRKPAPIGQDSIRTS